MADIHTPAPVQPSNILRQLRGTVAVNASEVRAETRQWLRMAPGMQAIPGMQLASISTGSIFMDSANCRFKNSKKKILSVCVQTFFLSS
jgi:hypothetical protein